MVVVFYDTDLNHAGLHRGCSNLSCVVVWMWSDDSWIKTKKYSLYLLSDQKKSTKKCMSLCMCVTGCVSPIWTPSNPFTKWDTADGIRWEIGTARWILSDVPQVSTSRWTLPVDVPQAGTARWPLLDVPQIGTAWWILSDVPQVRYS